MPSSLFFKQNSCKYTNLTRITKINNHKALSYFKLKTAWSAVLSQCTHSHNLAHNYPLDIKAVIRGFSANFVVKVIMRKSQINRVILASCVLSQYAIILDEGLTIKSKLLSEIVQGRQLLFRSHV